MADYTEKLTAAACNQLEPGETFEAGTFCVPKGGIRRQALFTSFGALGAAVGTTKSAPQSHAVGGAKLPKQLVLGVTDRRLFIFTVTAMAGRPNKVHTIVPLTQVTAVGSGKGRSVGIKHLDLEITFVDGSGLYVEVPRVKVSDGQRFAAALEAALARADQSSLVDGRTVLPPPPAS